PGRSGCGAGLAGGPGVATATCGSCLGNGRVTSGLGSVPGRPDGGHGRPGDQVGAPGYRSGPDRSGCGGRPDEGPEPADRPGLPGDPGPGRPGPRAAGGRPRSPREPGRSDGGVGPGTATPAVARLRGRCRTAR